MLQVEDIAGFEWDQGNRRKSESKHQVSPPEAEQIFFNTPLYIADDIKHSEAEPRFQALGRTRAGRLLHATFTLRAEGTLIGVISARPMSKKERLRYDQEA